MRPCLGDIEEEEQKEEEEDEAGKEMKIRLVRGGSGEGWKREWNFMGDISGTSWRPGMGSIQRVYGDDSR